MKKILPLLLSMLIFAILTLGVSASDSAKASIYAAFLEACPEEFVDQYLPTVQATLDQITVTEEQASEVIPLIYDAKDIIIGATEVQSTETVTEEQESDEAVSDEQESGDAVSDTNTQEQLKDLIDKSSIGGEIKDIISDAIAIETPSPDNNLTEAEKQEKVISIVNDACNILGLTAKIDAKAITTANPTDIKLDIYSEGKKVATIDTPVKLTGGTKTTGITPIIVALILISLGVCGTTLLKKYEN